MGDFCNMKHIEQDLNNWIEKNFFNAMPMFVAVLDKDLNVIKANDAFEKKFGPWEGRHCFEVYKNQNTACLDCSSRTAFSSSQIQVSEQSGVDINGQTIHYIKYSVPVLDETGGVKYLAEISTETTRFKETEKEYQLLFERVPCNIIIIDRNFRIIRNNQRAENLFSGLKGEFCYAVLKGRKTKCPDCTARKTFEDGRRHTGRHIWHLPDGRSLHMHVITILIEGVTREQDMVMELGVDISNTIRLQDRLNAAHNYLDSIINTSMDGIVGISNSGKIEVFNKAARRLFNINRDQAVSLEDIDAMLPKGFLAEVSEEQRHVYVPEALLKRQDGETFYGRLIGNRLTESDETIGMAFSVHDISRFKKLEHEKIEAERMAIVGQTVAGLAHGIKNLINALDGGLYFLKSGISRGDIGRVHKGIETLGRNIERIRRFSRSFLNYTRVQDLQVRLCHPQDIVQEVIESFSVSLMEKNIVLNFKTDKNIAPALFDYEKIHEAITNLISNAIDAFSEIDDDRKKSINITLYEEEGTICFEVEDNGSGIDEEQKMRIFSKFFTTKGLEGTGLGLLMTKKIVQQHNGTITISSKKGEGSTFRIRFLRSRLPKTVDG
jgi:PAS domain S-box-containing protein